MNMILFLRVKNNNDRSCVKSITQEKLMASVTIRPSLHTGQ